MLASGEMGSQIPVAAMMMDVMINGQLARLCTKGIFDVLMT